MKGPWGVRILVSIFILCLFNNTFFISKSKYVGYLETKEVNNYIDVANANIEEPNSYQIIAELFLLITLGLDLNNPETIIETFIKG